MPQLPSAYPSRSSQGQFHYGFEESLSGPAFWSASLSWCHFAFCLKPPLPFRPALFEAGPETPGAVVFPA
jgi:hypothetical protein